MGQTQTILSTISPNNWMLLRRPRYRKYNRDHQPIESSIVHAGPTQSGPAADDSRKIRNSKPTCGCQRRTRPPSGAHHRACPIYEILNSTDLLRLQYVELLMQATVEQLTKEKWELSAANTDLQQRLQQTVTLAHMQVGNINLQFAHLNVSSNCSPNTIVGRQ